MKINDQTSSHEHCWHSYNGPVGAVATTPAPSPTVAHDSATCQLGPHGGKCVMCEYADEKEQRDTTMRSVIEAPSNTAESFDFENILCGVCSYPLDNSGLCIIDADHRGILPSGDLARDITAEMEQCAAIVEQSATTIRARRTALLERADARSPTEGARALAEAWLDSTDWYQKLPNNAMQDAAVLELAGEVESAVGNWLQGRVEKENQ